MCMSLRKNIAIEDNNDEIVKKMSIYSQITFFFSIVRLLFLCCLFELKDIQYTLRKICNIN